MKSRFGEEFNFDQLGTLQGDCLALLVPLWHTIVQENVLRFDVLPEMYIEPRL